MKRQIPLGILPVEVRLGSECYPIRAQAASEQGTSSFYLWLEVLERERHAREEEGGGLEDEEADREEHGEVGPLGHADVEEFGPQQEAARHGLWTRL